MSSLYDDFLTRVRARQAAVRISCSCDADAFGLSSVAVSSLRRRALPLHELFFCGDCSRLVCERCSEASIDSFFCPSCLKMFFSATASDNKNRCESCFECPCCFHTISPIVNPLTKQYSFLCEFCQWTSDDSSINLVAPDPVSLIAKAKARENEPDADAKYAALAMGYRERYQQSRGTPATGKPPSTAPSSKQSKAKIGSLQLHDFQGAVLRLDAELEKQAKAKAQTAPDGPVVIEEDARLAAMYGPASDEKKADAAFDVHALTSIPQRLSMPGSQPLLTSGLSPRRKPLLAKVAHRCRSCEKILVKPKTGANVVAFDVHHWALSYLPTITVAELPAFERNKAFKTVLYLRNPALADITVSLKPFPKTAASETKKESKGDSSGDGGDGDKEKQAAAMPMPRKVDHSKLREEPATASVKFPAGATYMTAYDEIATHGDIFQDKEELERAKKDDPSVVAYRYLSKVGMPMEVTPLLDTDIQFSLLVHLGGGNQGDNGFADFVMPVHISLGPTGAAASKPAPA